MRGRVSLALVLVVIAGTCITALAEDLPLKLVSIISPIGEGEKETLVVQTEPGAACQAHAIGKGVNFTLRPQVAGPKGLVSWSWTTTRGGYVVGTRQLQIVCTSGDRKATLLASFEVK
jgi:hypothetical protein